MKKNVKKLLGEYYWGGIAETYDLARVSDIRQRQSLEREARIIRSFLSRVKGDNILDIACGTGIMFKNYGKRKIYGVDISEDMIAIAKKK
ncbi:MAG: methyltransferase domain-containing protein, partial [Nanoarchaeota archaeon]|nr:methyltransferase domain-containing protein [Nanoarchaeota archaeon]